MPDFTKGKWAWDMWPPNEFDKSIAIITPAKVIANVINQRVISETNANARLIAAAPEMYGLLYEALQELKGYKPIENGISTVYPDIEALLARIDGKELNT